MYGEVQINKFAKRQVTMRYGLEGKFKVVTIPITFFISKILSLQLCKERVPPV